MMRDGEIAAASPALVGDSSNLWRLIALALGAMMAILDITAINVAFNDVQRSLHISFAGMTWVVDGYTLSFASLLLSGAALADRYGAKVVYVRGLALFTVASFVCGIATTEAMVVGARVVQGIGAAMFTPSALSLLAQAYRDDGVRARMVSRWAAMVSSAAVLGPLFGGALIHVYGWRSIFLVNIPFGALAILLTRASISTPGRMVPQRLNPVNHVTLMVGLATVCFVLIEGTPLGWGSAPMLVAYAVATGTFAALLYLEKINGHSIVSAELLGNAHFLVAITSFGLLALTFYAQFFAVGVFLQKGTGSSALHTGVQFLPIMAVIALANLLSGRVSRRYGEYIAILAGLAIAVLGAAMLLPLDTDVPYWWLASGMIVANMGNGIAAPALTSTVMRLAGQGESNVASGVLNFSRQLGALLGIALMGVILQESARWSAAMHGVFTTVIGVHLVSVALFLRFVPRPAGA